MADPKYAGLPGIATDQPDFYETFSDRDTDPVSILSSDFSISFYINALQILYKLSLSQDCSIWALLQYHHVMNKPYPFKIS